MAESAELEYGWYCVATGNAAAEMVRFDADAPGISMQRIRTRYLNFDI